MIGLPWKTYYAIVTAHKHVFVTALFNWERLKDGLINMEGEVRLVGPKHYFCPYKRSMSTARITDFLGNERFKASTVALPRRQQSHSYISPYKTVTSQVKTFWSDILNIIFEMSIKKIRLHFVKNFHDYEALLLSKFMQRNYTFLEL